MLPNFVIDTNAFNLCSDKHSKKDIQRISIKPSCFLQSKTTFANYSYYGHSIFKEA